MSTESFEVGNRSNSTLKWPQDLGDQEGGEPNFIIFTAKKRGLFKGSSKEKIIKTVGLPIPIGALASQYKANYENQSLGALAGAAMGAVSAAELAAESGGKGAELLEAGLGGLKASGGDTSNMEQNMQAAGSALIAGTNIGKFRNNVLGTIRNPFQFVTYSGPEFRTYSMNWTMIPSNKEEAFNIHAITKFFKKSVVPGVASSGTAFFFNMPPVFGIEMRVYKYRGGRVPPENGYVQRFAKSVLTSVEVDYNGMGAIVPTFAYDGRPTATKLTVSFQETTLITDEMVEEGY